MIAHELIAIPPFASEVAEGLAARPKSLPSKLFYDAVGSALFEEITRLPEYYLTRVELEILREQAGEFAEAARGMTIVELGAGSAAKTCTLLQALARKQMRVTYIPVDISPAALVQARGQVARSCPTVRVQAIETDLAGGFEFLKGIAGPKAVLYLGSSIGNFDPDAALGLLRQIRAQLGPSDALLLATDMVKDVSMLEAAYNDAQGVTAEFNKNILRRLNRELLGDFDLAAFRHVALWNPRQSRIEMHLESAKAQTAHLRLLQTSIALARGERIHTENSYKYTLPMARRMLTASEFKIERTWTDYQDWYALHWARTAS